MSRYSAVSFVIILVISSCVNYTQNIETVDVLNSSSRDDFTQINVVINFTFTHLLPLVILRHA